MSVLGARLGLAAQAALAAPGRRLVARYGHQTCALDGIQLTTRCTLGNGNLRVEPRGEHRLLLWAEGGDSGVEAILTGEALDLGRRYGALRQRAEELVADREARRDVRRQMEALLQALEEMPTEHLVAVQTGVAVDG